MHSVLSILNLILENLNIGFTDIIEHIKVKFLFFFLIIKICLFLKKASKKSTAYLENLFLTDVPFMLSESYRNTSADKKSSSSQVLFRFKFDNTNFKQVFSSYRHQ